MTHTDPSADAFMRCILADPADPVPRLVFADWLEETGKSSHLAWARFLRLADELANTPDDDPRRPKLADELDRVGSLVRAKLTFRAEVFVAYPDALRQLLPLRNMVLTLRTLSVPPAVLGLVPEVVARNARLLPLVVCGSALAVASSDPLDPWLIRNLEFVLKRDVLALRARESDIRAAVWRNYAYLTADVTVDAIDPTTAVFDATPVMIRPLLDDAPAVRLIEVLLGEAIRLRASVMEIEPHIGPDGIGVQVWHHYQGERRRRDPLPSRLLPGITARLRKLADISPILQPVQTGVIPLLHRGLSYRLPVRITATANGPHIHVTIPPAPADPPAVVVNPAA
ncbi:MAG TPA: TIGR02996 domain-containing protein [Fimbriiglobus sp.]|nr:TIGR02996 domain-containing protein [Fimbriiglobus sp.]